MEHRGTRLDQQGLWCMEHRGIYRRINDFWSPRTWSVERAIAEAFGRLTGNQSREAECNDAIGISDKFKFLFKFTIRRTSVRI